MYALATALPLMVCLVWTVNGLLRVRRSNPAQQVLLVFGIVSTVLYLCHYLHFNGEKLPFMESLYFLCTLSVYPLYNCYVYRLTTRSRMPAWKIALWLLPAVCMFCWSFFRDRQGAFDLAVKLLVPMVAVAASIPAAIRLVRFRKNVNNYYSSPEGKTLDPVFLLLVLQLMATLATSVVIFIGRDTFMSNSLLWVPSLLFSVLLFGIFYVGENTAFPSEEVQEAVKEPVVSPVPEEPASSYGMTEEQQALIMNRIEEQMSRHEIFRTKGLTVSDLAEAVGSNRTYVSMCINQVAGCTFSDYVNKARVRYVQELIRQGGDQPLTEMAEMAGFNERTAFYRSFKKETGLSPSTYLLRNRGE